MNHPYPFALSNRRSAILSICLLALLLLIPFVSHAQTDAATVLFHGTRVDNTTITGELVFIGATNPRTVSLPTDLFPSGSMLSELVLSPDQNVLAVTTQPMGEDAVNQVALYDLENESCCVFVPMPLENVAAFDLGEFSPDSSRLALSWVGFTDPATYSITGGMMIVDAATGQIVEQLSGEAIGAALGAQYPQPWALMGEWKEDGIRFIPNCYACEGVFSGEWSIWEPESNAITASSGERFDLFFGDVLDATGEMVYAGQDLRFPANMEGAYLPIPNVVYYITDETLPSFGAATDAPIIYQNASQIDLSGGAHWVLDGEAVLVTPANSDTWTLIFRDGRQQPVSATPGASFLVGTPTGWMTLSPGTLVTGYTLDEDGFVTGGPALSLESDNEFVRVVSAPNLGSNLSSVTAFPAVAEPQTVPTPTTVTCPNLLPPRLTVGGSGQVTPGTPNNLRSEPGTTAPLIGTIPGGAQFYVLNGPVCDEGAGIVWWQVEYSSQIGWTAESGSGTYFVEPVGVG